ncbi:MAG TPA: hypothetical protein VKA48_01570, partial [Gammaproteobacteria bacterium]|nr:hypothetical protein [Gammaproteobacteria bacterium]
EPLFRFKNALNFGLGSLGPTGKQTFGSASNKQTTSGGFFGDLLKNLAGLGLAAGGLGLFKGGKEGS